MNITPPYCFGRGYLYLPLNLSSGDLHDSIVLFGDTYYLKSEFHVSLVCVKLIQEKYPRVSEKDVICLFNQFIEEKRLNHVIFNDEYRIATHPDGRKSIIQKVSVENISNFYGVLRVKLGIHVDTPPTHVTIYTLQKDMGIGINTLVDFEKTFKIQFK